MAATEDLYARVQAVLGGGDVAPGADAEDGIVGAATVWFAAAVLVEIVASAAFDVKVGCVSARAVRTTRSRASGWLARVQVPS